MGLFDRLFGRSKPSGNAGLPAAPQQTELGGRVTALAAVAATERLVGKLVSDAQLSSISSDSNIDQNGLARGWELVYISLQRGSELRFELAPPADAEDIDNAPLLLTLTEQPFYEPLPDRAFAASVAKSLGRTVEQLEAERLREAVGRRQLTPLPQPILDSPAAVSSIAAQGLDFISGPTDLRLFTRSDPNGGAAWVVQDRRRDYSTPFAAAG